MIAEKATLPFDKEHYLRLELLPAPYLQKHLFLSGIRKERKKTHAALSVSSERRRREGEPETLATRQG